MSDRLIVAQWLVEQRGFSVIPLEPGGKKPIAKWTAFQRARPTRDNLACWFSDSNGHPARNLGIVTGTISGVIVIDCDSSEAVAWADAHLPPTAMRTRTAKGEHRFFRHPGVPVRNTARIRTDDARRALDIRGDGGYVVGPTSVHPSGATYERLGDWPPIEQLPAFDPTWLEPEEPPVDTRPESRARASVDRSDRERLIRRVRKYLKNTPPAIEGQGGDTQTYQLCCRLVRGFDLSDAEVLELLRAWNARCLPPWTDAELGAKIASARKYGTESIGARLTPAHEARALATQGCYGGNGSADALSAATASDAKIISVGTPRLTRLSDVAIEPIDWVWRRRVARGKYTLIAGDPGTGKSRVTFDMAARVTRGAPWPDGGHALQGSVLFLCAEDGLGDTVRPAIEAMGGDAMRIVILEGVVARHDSTRLLNLSKDLAVLEAAIAKVQPEFVVIDPITAYLGQTDSYKDAEVRGLLAPVLAALQRYRTALVAVAHLTKDQQRAALHRPGGSIAFVAAARLVFALATDPDDDDRRILAPLKANICTSASSLAFRLPDGRVEWESTPADIDAEALLTPSVAGGRGRARQAREDAEDFLRSRLADGRVESERLTREAKRQGISPATLRRAKAELKIDSFRVGYGTEGLWYCALPSHSTQVSTFEAEQGQNPDIPQRCSIDAHGEEVSIFDETLGFSHKPAKDAHIDQTVRPDKPSSVGIPAGRPD